MRPLLLDGQVVETQSPLNILSPWPGVVCEPVSTANPDQAREVAKHADAVVVGSAIVDLIAKHGDKPAMIEKVATFARELATAVH